MGEDGRGRHGAGPARRRQRPGRHPHGREHLPRGRRVPRAGHGRSRLPGDRRAAGPHAGAAHHVVRKGRTGTMTRSPLFFPEDAVIRRVDSERVLLLGGPRAILMQLAHPLVARGVAEHSDFQADPFARLRRTLEVTYGVVFGTVEQARTLATQVRAVHHTVRGDGYEANDPTLLQWVAATLTHTALRVHARFLGGLAPKAAEQYYRESRFLNEVFGVPAEMQPPDLAAFRAYVRRTVASLVVTDDARRLAHDVLHPRL